MTPSHGTNYIMYGNTTRSTSHLADIQSWIIHPQYLKNNSDYDHDIAVVRVKDQSISNSSSVYRIPLLSDVNTLESGLQGYVMGYGYSSLGESESSQLMQIEETIVSIGAENSSELIVAKSSPYSGVCHGDSGDCMSPFSPRHEGGPLVVKQNGVWTVAGVTARILNAYDPNPESPTCPVSYDESQASENGYVSVAVMLDWIANATSLTTAELMAPPSTASANGTSASPDNTGYQTTSSGQPTCLSNSTFIFTLWFILWLSF
ncbi:hypothetical protein INT43_008107 [Umbelopsis isabellina]|uniref:Peptidase S1 domain-containing protein n=1 Tax=Mortierella isabellina TaxID=91625 RepID=A0A8H7U8A6_MORIS|nr:hypothetical protein INT43_008107 [Umbelopsis isabellina]